MFLESLRKILLKSSGDIQGQVRIRGYKNGEVISDETHKNRVVSSNGHGRNLLIRQLTGDTTYGIEVDSGKIGNDGTAPVDGNTDLGNAVVSNIVVEATSFSNDECTFSFFILDGDLADGTYKEFGLFIGSQMLARAVFSNDYVKTTGVDTRVDYAISLNAS